MRVQSVFLVERTTSTGWGRFILINFPSFPTTGTFPVPPKCYPLLGSICPRPSATSSGEHSWRFGSSLLSVATAANVLPKVVEEEEEGTNGPSRFSILFWRMTWFTIIHIPAPLQEEYSAVGRIFKPHYFWSHSSSSHCFTNSAEERLLSSQSSVSIWYRTHFSVPVELKGRFCFLPPLLFHLEISNNSESTYALDGERKVFGHLVRIEFTIIMLFFFLVLVQIGFPGNELLFYAPIS